MLPLWRGCPRFANHIRRNAVPGFTPSAVSGRPGASLRIPIQLSGENRRFHFDVDLPATSLLAEQNDMTSGTFRSDRPLSAPVRRYPVTAIGTVQTYSRLMFFFHNPRSGKKFRSCPPFSEFFQIITQTFVRVNGIQTIIFKIIFDEKKTGRGALTSGAAYVIITALWL